MMDTIRIPSAGRGWGPPHGRWSSGDRGSTVRTKSDSTLSQPASTHAGKASTRARDSIAAS